MTIIFLFSRNYYQELFVSWNLKYYKIIQNSVTNFVRNKLNFPLPGFSKYNNANSNYEPSKSHKLHFKLPKPDHDPTTSTFLKFGTLVLIILISFYVDYKEVNNALSIKYICVGEINETKCKIKPKLVREIHI